MGLWSGSMKSRPSDCRFANPQFSWIVAGTAYSFDSLPPRWRMGGARVVGKDPGAEPLVKQ